MEWHPSGVTRTRIQVIRVNFSEFFVQGKGSKFSASYPRSTAALTVYYYSDKV